MPSWFNVVLNDIQPSQLVNVISENQKGKTHMDKAALPATVSDLLIPFLHLIDKEVMITRIEIDNHSGKNRVLK